MVCRLQYILSATGLPARSKEASVLTARRTLIIGSCLLVVAIAAACGGGPTSPSEIAGTTIAGTVNAPQAAVSSPSAASTGLTVTVVGTNLTATVEPSGYFQLNGVPSGTVTLQFRDGAINATVRLSNVGREALIEIQVQLRGASAVIVDEVRSDSKVSLCHGTGNGSYHLIDVSNSAESAHRAHGDGKVGDPVPGQPLKVFDRNCSLVAASAVQIVKSTNGQDANEAPGPTIVVGSAVTWTYVVTNTGTQPVTNVVVRDDDRNVTVTCPATTVAAGQSMTCRGTGVARAGQYRNVGTVTANSGTSSVTDTDASHYFGQAPVTTTPPTPTDGARVQLCHRTGNGRYQLLEVSRDAEPAHRAHGDGKIGEAVPGMAGKVFGPGCSVN